MLIPIPNLPPSPVCIFFIFSVGSTIRDIIWYLFFSVWITSLSMLISKSIHVAANDLISLFFMAIIPYCVCVCVYCVCMYVYNFHTFFIYSSVDGHFVYFHVLAIVSSAAMNIEGHVSFWIMVFSRSMPRSGFTDHMVMLLLVFCFFFFNFLIEGKLLYRILCFFVTYQQESAIGTPMYPPLWTSLLSPSASHLSHPSLSQSPCLNSLSHTANSHWLSILHRVF